MIVLPRDKMFRHAPEDLVLRAFVAGRDAMDGTAVVPGGIGLILPPGDSADQLLGKFVNGSRQAMTLLQEDLVVVGNVLVKHCFRTGAGKRIDSLIVVTGPKEIFTSLSPLLN